MIKANHWKLTLFWLPTSIACVYLFASKQGIVTRLLSKSKALVWLGNLSGEAFLIHQICIKAVETAFSNRIMIAIIAFILTFICTFIWRWLFNKCRLILK